MTRSLLLGRRHGSAAAGFIVLALIGLGAVATHADPKPSTKGLETTAIDVAASPIRSFAKFGDGDAGLGKLQFRGGLVLQSEHKNFGGWSGLVVDEDARRFFSISDTGVWMTGAIEYDNGRPSAVKEVRLGPLLGKDGSVLTRNIYRDAEGVAMEGGNFEDGTLLISFERRPRVVRYRLTGEGVERPVGALELPSHLRSMGRNQGFEAVTVMKGGAYNGRPVVFAERLYDAARNHTGWLWTAKAVEKIHLVNIGDFDVTDIASDASGALFVLERRFRWTEGVKMRLRRIAPEDVKPGTTLRGDTLIEADMSSEIDNMEGLSIARMKDGGTLITMISDDNMNRALQRTLLLQFVWRDGEAQRARLQ